MKKILIEYWRSDALKINLGDYIIEHILNCTGVPVECYSEALNRRSFSADERCLLGVGTLIDAHWLTYIKPHKDIWGCGYAGDQRLFKTDYKETCTFHAVRGPLTRDALGLPGDFPIGDPGLLLPHLTDFSRNPSGQVLYIPHFETRDALRRNTLELIGADDYLDICCLRTEFCARLERIANAKFILTTSLHGAIIAQAYGVPWALCCPPQARHNMPGKWEDWFAYLGLHVKFCDHLDDAVRWWERFGSKGTIRDLEPLIRSFPGPPLPI